MVVPPRVKLDAGAEYPAQALREGFDRSTTVDLIVEVDSTGRVRNVLVDEPRGHGFDDAAVAAAKKLVFEPATRDGQPVAARIRFRYSFSPPHAQITGRVARQPSDAPLAGAVVTVRDSTGVEHTATTGPDGTWTIHDLPPGPAHIRAIAEGRTAEQADLDLANGAEITLVLRLRAVQVSPGPSGFGDAGAAPVQEVTVTGERPPREVARRTLSRDEILHSAGTQGDALLSLQNLPGVARPPAFSGLLVVRGSAPQDTNIFIDGTDIPLVYHFGGLSSVVPTELLDKIDFFPGNYSAQYGRGMGGAVDVSLRDPKKDGYRAFSENSLLGFRLLAEGPIVAGWTFFAAAQRSWLDLVLTPVLKAVHSPTTALPRWYDYQAAIQKDFGRRTSFRLLFLGSDDAYDVVNVVPSSTDPTVGGDLGYHTAFWRLQARFESQPSENTRIRSTVAYGQDLVTESLGSNLFNATLHPLSGRVEISDRLVPGFVLNTGLDVVYEPYDLTLQIPPVLAPGTPAAPPGQLPLRSVTSSTLFLPAGYVEGEMSLWSGSRVVPGFRVDYDSATQRFDLAPRLNLRQALAGAFPRTTFKGGIGVYDQPPNPLETDATFGQAHLTSNRSIQMDVGFEQEFTRHLDLSVDVFYKWLDHLVVPNEGNAGSGFAYGVEWLLRYKPDEHFFGWISYTMSRSERRNDAGQGYTLFQFDQPQVLTVIGNYKLGKGWQLGARFRLTSGDLYTPFSTGAYDATAGSQLGVAGYPPYTSRLPLFDQLDLRVERTRLYLNGRLRVTVYLDLQNVYMANNPLSVSYNYNYSKQAFVNGLPILPIVGVQGDFH